MIRLQRDEINGAMYYTAALLQQLVLYLGLQLPFTMHFAHGRVILEAANTFTHMYGPVQHVLFLSRSTYRTLQSEFTTLPEQAYTSETLSVPLLGMEGIMYNPTEACEPPRAAGLPSSSASFVGLRRRSKGPSFAELGTFPHAWMMLVYNIVYLAYTQGFKISRLTAATNPLWLLYQTVYSPHFAAYVAFTHLANHIRRCSLPSTYATSPFPSCPTPNLCRWLIRRAVHGHRKDKSTDCANYPTSYSTLRATYPSTYPPPCPLANRPGSTASGHIVCSG